MRREEVKELEGGRRRESEKEEGTEKLRKKERLKNTSDKQRKQLSRNSVMSSISSSLPKGRRRPCAWSRIFFISEYFARKCNTRAHLFR